MSILSGLFLLPLKGISSPKGAQCKLHAKCLPLKGCVENAVSRKHAFLMQEKCNLGSTQFQGISPASLPTGKFKASHRHPCKAAFQEHPIGRPSHAHSLCRGQANTGGCITHAPYRQALPYAGGRQQGGSPTHRQIVRITHAHTAGGRGYA